MQPRPAKPRRLALFFDLPQDVEVLLPYLTAAQEDPRFDVQLWYTRRLRHRWPAAYARLRLAGAETGVGARPFSHRLLRFSLTARLAVDCLLTASESSERTHYATHNLVKIANRDGIATYTLQHGFENIGLTYRDATQPEIRFAARRVLTWGGPADLPNWVPVETRAKAIGIGRAAPLVMAGARLPEIQALPPRRILVCHNLHWGRYTAAYHARFFEQLLHAATAFPGIGFILRGHPGAMTRHPVPKAWPHLPNLTVVDRLTALAPLLGAVERVITTPSTIAVDAAQAGLPVAVVAGDLALPLYAPLPQLREPGDWADFIENGGTEHGETFLAKHILPGDAVSRALDLIASAE